MARKATITNSYLARIPTQTYDRLVAMSVKRERSINSEIVHAIEAAWIEYTAEIAEDFGVAESDQVKEN